MKLRWLVGSLLAAFLVYQICDHLIQKQRAKCLFYREGKCITCDSKDAWPVGYKENCICENRTPYYVSEGLFPAWQCLLEKTEDELPSVSISNINCPEHHPLKDILGNCYACDVEQPIKIAHASKGSVCDVGRYIVPDSLVDTSMKCPSLSDIEDPYVCVSCGGVVWDGKCFNEGENHFCRTNEDCPVNEWCFPFYPVNEKTGVCAKRLGHAWFCSGTDGYDLNTTQEICVRQGMHIPTLDEIEQADEDLSLLCPSLDMWVFFAPDGVVWLESFVQEFLFTREGESDKLGGHSFHALCHKD